MAIIITIQPALGESSSENYDMVIIAKGAGGNLEGGDPSVAEAGQDCVTAQNCFSPNTLIIDAGQTVTWLNDDVMGHTVTSGQPSDNQTGTIFDSPAIAPGKEFSHTYQNSGVYDYFCQIHPWMTGSVIIRTMPDTSKEIDSSQAIAAKINITRQANIIKTIDKSVYVHADSMKDNSFSISISAPSQTGPKVFLINLQNNAMNVTNLRYLQIRYDGLTIQQASNVNSILHAKTSDDPSYFVLANQGGAQVMVMIPYFSNHTITVTNLSKIISPIPEFPTTDFLLIITFIPAILYSMISKVYRY